ncbi:MAG TPA: hypothetical protein VJ440_03535, partial [Candidatus Brocadiaceae bacterium]|nr:hypothetical protein [Candidatus Brocadiaceae bacterium]
IFIVGYIGNLINTKILRLNLNFYHVVIVSWDLPCIFRKVEAFGSICPLGATANRQAIHCLFSSKRAIKSRRDD